MGLWSAIALPSVDEESIKHAIASKNISPNSVAHVSATSSHARAIRGTGEVSVAIANLIDLIVMTGLNDNLGLSLNDFPSGDVFKQGGDIAEIEKTYRGAIKAWQNKLKAKRTALSLSCTTELRRFLRQPNVDVLSAKVLLDSKREFFKTIQTLIASGIFSSDLDPDDKIGQVAKLAWAKIETSVPLITATRDDLWIDLEEFEQASTPKARDLRNRIDKAIDQIFAIEGESITILYHGFYFFTPQQWALFQLLRKIPKVDQVFIVHDDGQNPVFETWRRFFCEGWDMPKVELLDAADKVTSQAGLFRKALSGNSVKGEGSQVLIDVKECKNPAEFVRQLNLDRAIRPKEFEREPLAYASGSEDLKRITRRLSRTSADGKVDLSQLPIGIFLLSAHECIRRKRTGRVTIELASRPVLDMIASGYLDDGNNLSSEFLSMFERVMPFFSDCTDKTSWSLRAETFHRLIADEVVHRGARDDNQSDLVYMREAANNSLRRVPWLDVSLADAEMVEHTIVKICDLITGIASGEEVKLANYMEFLEKYLRRALQEVPQSERQEVVEKLNSFKFNLDDSVFVDDLVEIVHLLISRENNFGFENDDGSELDDVITELRSLDSLGFRRLDRGIHLANLADGVFPSKVGVIGWPFFIGSIELDKSPAAPISVEILKARSQNSALSDLYLFWLALDGVNNGHVVMLSWISDTGREERNLSPVVSVLTEPDHFSKAILNLVGGIKISTVSSAAGLPPTRSCLQPSLPTITDEVLANAIALVDARASASSLICARRFAIQWAMGNSSAFLASHQQAHLYGNTIGALARREHIAEEDAIAICDDLWRFMTNGERASSRSRARVVAQGPTADAPTWPLTLLGSRDGVDLFSAAYRHARERNNIPRQLLDPDDIAPVISTFLPPRNANCGDVDICGKCPVKSRCLSAHDGNN
jgi:hypothetical protein